MAEWIRFEDGRSRNRSEYGTIMKDGRLVISNDIARASGVVPGAFVEVYYKPQDKQIGIKVVPAQTPYSLKVILIGPKAHPFDQPLKNAEGKTLHMPMACVSLRSFLNSRHIGLASKVRGHLYKDEVSDMLVFEFPDAPQVVTPSTHAAEQLVKKAFTERVSGDIG
jgi:hypothetical protein